MRLVGAILLVAGSCIGAGMLGLPLVTGLAGFTLSLLAFFIGWVFMAATGLLLLEANLVLGREVSLVTMAGEILGRFGKVLTWILFCFLFYFLLVAYVAGIGPLLVGVIGDLFGGEVSPRSASIGSVCLMGVLVWFGTRAVDYVNRLLMLGLVLSYLILIVLGFPSIEVDNLAYFSLPPLFLSIPVIVISFGYHNMIPTLTRYLKGRRLFLISAILVGSFLTLVVYLFWEALILGLVPVEGMGGLQESAQKGELATIALRRVVGRGWVSLVGQIFSICAIATSFVAQALSLVHFLADGFRLPRSWPINGGLTLLAVLPPLIAGLFYPGIFVWAIEIAGAFGAVILFGILPALMVWKVRYQLPLPALTILPGGRISLVVVLGFSILVIALQLLHQFGVFI